MLEHSLNAHFAKKTPLFYFVAGSVAQVLYGNLTPHATIRYTDKFDDPNLPGEMQVTIKLRKVLCGTELEIVGHRAGG